jgi:hypothetical protein
MKTIMCNCDWCGATGTYDPMQWTTAPSPSGNITEDLCGACADELLAAHASAYNEIRARKLAARGIKAEVVK